MHTIISVDALQVFSRGEVNPTGMLDTDPRSPNYGNSELYTITPSSGGQSMTVHHSRLLFFGGRQTDRRARAANGGWDDTWYESIVDALYRVEAVSASGATHARRLVIPIATLKDLKNQQSSKGGPSFVERMKHTLRSFSNTRGIVLPAGDSINLLSASISGFKDLDENAKTNLSANEGLHVSILFGATPGNRLGGGDDGAKDSLDATVSAWQEFRLRPPMERLYSVIFASQEGPTKGVVPERWHLNFAPLAMLSETEIITNKKTVAETDAIYIDLDVYQPEDVQEARFSGQYSSEMIDVESTDDLGAVEEE